MTEADLEKAEPSRLADIMAMDDRAGRIWRPEELAALLEHQLSVPLEFDLASIVENAPDPPDINQHLVWTLTFRELFSHPEPPRAMLQRVKRFAKSCRTNPASPIPAEVATVLYFACVVVALMRCSESISDLSSDALREGVTWVSRQPWLDPSLRKLFEEAEQFLKRNDTQTTGT